MPDIDPPIANIVINGHTYTNADWESNPTGTLSDIANDIAAVVEGYSIPLFAIPDAGDSYVSLDLFVAKTGDDADNDCRVSGSPCLTIAAALESMKKYHLGGGNVRINFGNGNWTEDVFVNGTPGGGLNTVAIPDVGNVWPSLVLLSGNGRTNTEISGSGNLCATVCASQFAIIGLEDIKISGDDNACQSPIFVQMGGTIHVFGGVEIGAAGSEQLHAENPGSSIQIWENYYLSGGGITAFGVANSATIIIGAGAGTVVGTPDYSSGFIFARNLGSVQINVADPWIWSGVTGSKFNLNSNSVLEGDLTPSDVPGDLVGKVSSGAVIRSMSGISVFGTSGLGAGGLATLESGSTPLTGKIIITAGSVPDASGVGTVVLDLPYMPTSGTGFYISQAVQGGTGTWALGAFCSAAITDEDPARLTVNFANGGEAPLVNGDVYHIHYMAPY